MKSIIAVLSLICLPVLFTSCEGSDKAELRMELQLIEQEMVLLEMVAYNLRSPMSQAEWQSFFGSFAGGYGLVGGNGQLALRRPDAWKS